MLVVVLEFLLLDRYSSSHLVVLHQMLSIDFDHGHQHTCAAGQLLLAMAFLHPSFDSHKEFGTRRQPAGHSVMAGLLNRGAPRRTTLLAGAAGEVVPELPRQSTAVNEGARISAYSYHTSPPLVAVVAAWLLIR